VGQNLPREASIPKTSGVCRKQIQWSCGAHWLSVFTRFI